MKILSLLFLATLLFAHTFNSPQQPEEPAELQEATALNDSAVKLFNAGKYDEALTPARRALQIREKLLPRNDPRISSSLNNLGEIYLAKKDYKPAKEVYLRLLQIQEELFGREDVNLAFTLDRLAVVYFVAGNDRETEIAYKRALELREKSLGPNDVQVAQSLFALGEFYRLRKKLEPALENYRRALELYGKLTGTTTPEFKRASDGFTCLGYDHHKPELFKELTEIEKHLSGRDTADEAEGVAVLNGRALSLPKPEYPGAAAARRLMGLVIVRVEIDEAGNVISAYDMCQGPPFLSEASVAAARKARFAPMTVNGQPVRVKGVIQYNFTTRFR
jgi:TonB family protein